MKPAAWNREAETLLQATLDGFSMDLVREQVCAGELELWEFGEAYAVTEVSNGRFYVWGFAGKGLRRAAPQVLALAWVRGCKRVLFRTGHRGIVRMLHRFGPRRLHQLTDTHAEYEIAVAA